MKVPTTLIQRRSTLVLPIRGILCGMAEYPQPDGKIVGESEHARFSPIVASHQNTLL
jgi:hypothetical protein